MLTNDVIMGLVEDRIDVIPTTELDPGEMVSFSGRPRKSWDWKRRNKKIHGGDRNKKENKRIEGVFRL